MHIKPMLAYFLIFLFFFLSKACTGGSPASDKLARLGFEVLTPSKAFSPGHLEGLAVFLKTL